MCPAELEPPACVRKRKKSYCGYTKKPLLRFLHMILALVFRFDGKNEVEGENDESLKEMYTAQQKQLYNLKTQV